MDDKSSGVVYNWNIMYEYPLPDRKKNYFQCRQKIRVTHPPFSRHQCAKQNEAIELVREARA